MVVTPNLKTSVGYSNNSEGDLYASSVELRRTLDRSAGHRGSGQPRSGEQQSAEQVGSWIGHNNWDESPSPVGRAPKPSAESPLPSSSSSTRRPLNAQSSLFLQCFMNAILATVGGACGKLGLSQQPGAFATHWGVRLGYRAVMILCMTILNTLSLQYYVGALRHTTAFRASIVCFALSFVAAGIVGFVLFGELLSLSWLLGAVLIVSGAGFITETKNGSL